MEKYLFLCNSVYQLLFALNIRLTLLENEEVDFIISDQMNGSEQLTEKINQYIENSSAYNLIIKSDLNHGKGKIAYVYEIIKIKNAITNLGINRHKYTILGYANLDLVTSLLYEEIAGTCKKCFVFEDGLATYSEDFFRQFDNETKKRKYAKATNEWWVIRENDIHYKRHNINLIQVPLFDKGNKSLICKFNKVFGYDGNLDIYDKKIVFFEESYFTDKGYRDDEKVVSVLAEKYGKDNIMIKIHPRNSVNRFEQMGYKTNKNTAVPWELIVMNEDISDKILCTMMSSSVFAPWMMGIDAKVVMFFDCVNYEMLNPRFLPVIEDICENNDTLFCVPNSFEEFMRMEGI